MKCHSVANLFGNIFQIGPVSLHWAPTVCIQVPTLLTKDANQSHRNTLTLRGAQVDEVAADCVITWWRAVGGAYPSREITLTAIIVAMGI